MHAKSIHGRMATLSLVLLLTACNGPIGDEYSDADAVTVSDAWQNWVIIGSLGPPGPFELVDVFWCEVNEPCAFSHNGESHTYDKFYDFKLAVLKLETPDGEVAHLVLRSRQKVYENS